jgi:hypothetical protein
MARVRSVGSDFFPLDEELELLPGSLTPHAHECLVRLGTWIPSFKQASQELANTLQVNVSEAMSRRRTEAAGAAYEAVQRQEVERIEQKLPAPPQGADKIQVSADGTMVPLVGGEWTEVKTVAIGEIGKTIGKDGKEVVQTENISYFSRKIEAQQFNRLALGEMHRRGVEQAQQVAAPADGAEWIQSFVDFHCPQAIRILDFPHAAERVSEIGQAVFGSDEAPSHSWLEHQLHQLKYEGPTELLKELRRLQTQHPTLEILADNLAYLEKRKAHMQYPTFQAQGLPIGSGVVESGHKVVVHPRLKGAGMHWSPDNVNPMVALRTLVCNDRWHEQWPKIAAQLRQEVTQRRRALREKRCAQKAILAHSSAPSPPPVTQTTTSLDPASSVGQSTPTTSPSSPQPPTPYRPAPNHPWRRSPIGRARFQPNNFSKN